jgi:hypothetical protein
VALWRILCRYSNAIAVFLWFQRRDGRYVDDVKLLNNLSDEPLEACEQAWEHLSSCFLNAAAVLMKQKQYNDACHSCTKALEFRPTAKGHYRRAQVKPLHSLTSPGLEFLSQKRYAFSWLASALISDLLPTHEYAHGQASTPWSRHRLVRPDLPAAFAGELCKRHNVSLGGGCKRGPKGGKAGPA